MYNFEIKTGGPDTFRKTRSIYQFENLKVGKYFVVPADSAAAQKNSSGQPRIASPAYAYAKSAGVKLKIQKMSDGSYHVYRTA
jgi:hypothetical protein